VLWAFVVRLVWKTWMLDHVAVNNSLDLEVIDVAQPSSQSHRNPTISQAKANSDQVVVRQTVIAHLINMILRVRLSTH
jgi:hypothetical protein